MKLGFIGAGNMGSAIINGILNHTHLSLTAFMSAANTLKKARNWLKKAFTSCRITYRWLNQRTAFCWPLSPFTPAGVLREIHDHVGR